MCQESTCRGRISQASLCAASRCLAHVLFPRRRFVGNIDSRVALNPESATITLYSTWDDASRRTRFYHFSITKDNEDVCSDNASHVHVGFTYLLLASWETGNEWSHPIPLRIAISHLTHLVSTGGIRSGETIEHLFTKEN